ncbi:MAG: hypothetical protein AB7F23_08595 [Phycisphaerae bacterium]|jgi:hypothetical protein
MKQSAGTSYIVETQDFASHAGLRTYIIRGIGLVFQALVGVYVSIFFALLARFLFSFFGRAREHPREFYGLAKEKKKDIRNSHRQQCRLESNGAIARKLIQHKKIEVERETYDNRKIVFIDGSGGARLCAAERKSGGCRDSGRTDAL